MIYKNLLSRQTTRFDGRGDYQAPDHMHTRTKLSYVCARAKSLEHSLPLKLICYGKEGSERIESWHLAGSNLFLSFWEIFFLFTFSKYDRPLNESTTCRGNFWKRPKNNSQICNFQLKKKKKTPTKWLSFLAKSAYSQPTDCRALDGKKLTLVSHDIDG